MKIEIRDPLNRPAWSIEVPREFWRNLFAGLALAAYPPTMAVPGGAAAAAVRDADAVLAELEKEVPSA